MPKRSTTHVTGEAAVRAFEALMPEIWVSREKHAADYGVDLEVELFMDDGTDTGLMFNVQSKGTESDKEGLKLSIKTETLRYLASFDIPAIIFRHSATTGRSYWLWATEALARSKPDAKTVSLKFSDNNAWDDGTPVEILRSLVALRLIKERAKWQRFPLVSMTGQTAEDVGRHTELLEKLSRQLPILDAHASEDGIPICVTADTDTHTIQISIERVYEQSAEFDPSEPDGAASTLAYLLVHFLSQLGFDRQAERIARQCVENEWRAHSVELAAHVALATLNRPALAIEVAVMNDLHSKRDQYSGLFSASLRNVVSAFPEHVDDFIRYCEREIATQSASRPCAELWYSLANFNRSQRRYAAAMSCYNRARKDDADYLNRTYFFREVGGVLFMTGHHSCAAIAYGKLVSMEPTPQARLYLGDAHLYDGDWCSAKTVLKAVADGDLTSVGAEANLKIGLANWLSGLEDFPDLKNWDDLHSLREKQRELEDTDGFFWSHVALTFYFEDDPKCWADAYFQCMLSGEVDLLRDMMLCGAKRCGIYPFNLLVEQRPEFFAHLGDGMTELRDLAHEANFNAQSEEQYEPGVAINEPEELARRGVLRMIPSPGHF